jgi:hypothetical protein
VAGEFVCAACTLVAAKVTAPTERALEVAEMLVYLKANCIKGSSQDTYASALHRYTHFATQVLGMPVSAALPPGPGGVIPVGRIELFLAFAARKYKHGTIQATLNALASWHASKDAPTDTVRAPAVKKLMRSIAQAQGPKGVPLGKEGMTISLLRLLLARLKKLQSTDAPMAALYTRDAAWLVLGFFGMLRRSELIALQMRHITVGTHPAPHVNVHIARSKTDTTGRGATIMINSVTRSGIKVGQLVQALVDIRRASGAAPDAPLFTAWDLDTHTLSSRSISSGQALAKRLQVYLSALHADFPNLPVHPGAYGMHSLRRGGATAAWEGGVSRDKIMAHGRWSSSAVDRYLVATSLVKLSVTSAM